MRAESVVINLLKASAAVTAQIGSRVYLTRMAENDAFPALVVEAVSGQPLTPIDAFVGTEQTQLRLQVTALGKNVDDVKTLLENVRAAINYKSGLLPGFGGGATFNVQVQSIVRDTIGPDGKDDQTSVYYQSHDYQVTFWDK